MRRSSQEQNALLVVTPNLAISAHARSHPNGYQSKNVLVLADGAPIIWVSRLAGTPLPQRVAGSDLVMALVAAPAAGEGSGPRRIALIGGSEGAAEDLSRDFAAHGWEARSWAAPASALADHHYRSAMTRELGSFRPDVTAIGIGHPQQEDLARGMMESGVTGSFLCIGMAIDYAAGRARRAPLLLQRWGAEWLWRLLAEPRRLARRYLITSMSELVKLSIWAVRARWRESH
jgi:N-acetylglucosaminyldiphosphoundecaprenol N-acetyl-beta-D-mannosaminyltransferase